MNFQKHTQQTVDAIAQYQMQIMRAWCNHICVITAKSCEIVNKYNERQTQK